MILSNVIRSINWLYPIIVVFLLFILLLFSFFVFHINQENKKKRSNINSNNKNITPVPILYMDSQDTEKIDNFFEESDFAIDEIEITDNTSLTIGIGEQLNDDTPKQDDVFHSKLIEIDITTVEIPSIPLFEDNNSEAQNEAMYEDLINHTGESYSDLITDTYDDDKDLDEVTDFQMAYSDEDISKLTKAGYRIRKLPNGKKASVKCVNMAKKYGVALNEGDTLIKLAAK